MKKRLKNIALLLFSITSSVCCLSFFKGKPMEPVETIKIKYAINSQPVAWKDNKRNGIIIAFPMAPVPGKGRFPSNIPIDAYWIDGKKVSGFPPSMLFADPLSIYFGNYLTTGDVNDDGQDELIAIDPTRYVWIFGSEGDVIQGRRKIETDPDSEEGYLSLMNWPAQVVTRKINNKYVKVLEWARGNLFRRADLKCKVLQSVRIDDPQKENLPVYTDSNELFILSQYASIAGIDLMNMKTLPNFPVEDERLRNMEDERGYMLPTVYICALHSVRKLVCCDGRSDTLLLVDMKSGEKTAMKIEGAKKIAAVSSAYHKTVLGKKECLYLYDKGTQTISITDAKGKILGSLALNLDPSFDYTVIHFSAESPSWTKENYMFLQLDKGQKRRTEELYNEWVGEEEGKKIEKEMRAFHIKRLKTEKLSEEAEKLVRRDVLSMKDSFLMGRFGNKYIAQEYTPRKMELFIIKTDGKTSSVYGQDGIEYFTNEAPERGPSIFPIIHRDDTARVIYFIVPLNDDSPDEKKNMKSAMLRVFTVKSK